MSTTRAALTDSDIRTLVKGATPDERALAAHKLCRVIDRETLSDEDRAKAQDILRVMASDAAELVRRTLAVTLKSSPLVPRDVAVRLARDVESISLPVLNFSPVFSDEDLSEIVRLGGPVRQIAIAGRPQVSEKVTAALVQHGSERAVTAVCANDNARFADKTLNEAIDRFEQSDKVLRAVAYRHALPPAVTEKLIQVAGDALREHLLSNQAVSPEMAMQIVLGAKERATIDLVDQIGRAADPMAFARHLHQLERLNASLLLRALVQGHMTFFECGVAALAGVPHHRTWLMIHDAGPLGLRAIYERAGLPARLFSAFRAGVDTWHSLEFDGGPDDKARFQERMIQRFLTQPQTAGRDDIDYLLDKMDRIKLSASEERAARQGAAA